MALGRYMLPGVGARKGPVMLIWVGLGVAAAFMSFMWLFGPDIIHAHGWDRPPANPEAHWDRHERYLAGLANVHRHRNR